MLDVFKGVGVLSIIFIHAALCTGLSYGPLSAGAATIGQLGLLFEAPLLFFLSGWAATYSQNTIKRTATRFIRLYVPYAVMIIFLALSISAFFNEPITPYDVVRWLALDNLYTKSLPVVMASMWFFVTYFLVYLTTPLLAKVYKNDIAAISLLVLLVAANVAFTLSSLPIDAFRIYSRATAQIFLFYLLFYFLGMYLNGRVLTSKQFIASFLATASLFLLILYRLGFSLSLQQAKFPPTSSYLVASLFSILVVLYARNFEDRVSRLARDNAVFKFLGYGGKNVLSLCLYEGFGSSVPTLALPFLFAMTTDWRLIFVIDLAMILLITFPLAHIFKAIDGYVLNVLTLVYDSVSNKVTAIWPTKG